MTVVTLSLVSHTNVGKTTLARTLLVQEVGEVRDAPHVTDSVDAWTLLRTGEGDELRLADTPGFGDSARLLKRLRGRANPIGWFLSEVWDRWRDRPFWASQQALAQVKANTDLVLYLVSAAESPEGAGYVAPEMALLDWAGKPVVVLLNQLGAPREPAVEAAEVERWRRHLAGRPVLPLDAFARCWVQEGLLWRTLHDALPADDERRAAMARLAAAWTAERLATFDAAVGAMADALAQAALQRAPLPDGAGGLREKLGAAIARLGKAGDEGGAAAVAQRALNLQLGEQLQAMTTRLVQLHGLAGDAERQIPERVAGAFELRERVDEGKAALWGGAVTGALAGLKADIASGGLTLGGGLLVGAVLGALGGAGIARGVNVVRGSEQSWVAWSAAALHEAAETALLTYLAVAHFGRGRGAWVQGEAPAHWRGVAQQALGPQRAALDALWAARGDGDAAPEVLARSLHAPLAQATRAALEALYPGAWPDHNRAVPATTTTTTR
jgi:hypothetical protein